MEMVAGLMGKNYFRQRAEQNAPGVSKGEGDK
jgi:hypothetical protein